MVATAHIQNRDFFSRRFMKRLLLLGELTVDRKELVSELSLSVHPISNNAAGFLYTLALTADSHQEIIDNFKEYIDNGGRCPYNTNSLSRLVFCHGLTEGTSRYNRLKSINSQKAIKQINDGKSKEATIFFDKLTETNLFDGYDLWYASNTNGEYWIRDIDNNSKYYYIDFCVPELKIAIEYHGVKYHPKHQHDTNYELGRFGTLKPLSEKWSYDEQKRKSILLRGYSYIEIWSDNVPSIDDLKTRLEEIIVENTRPILTL